MHAHGGARVTNIDMTIIIMNVDVDSINSRCWLDGNSGRFVQCLGQLHKWHLAES